MTNHTIIYVSLLVAIVLVQRINNYLESKKSKQKYVAYKDDYQKELDVKREKKSQESVLTETQKQAEQKRVRLEQQRQQQAAALELYTYNEKCRLAKNAFDMLPESSQKEAAVFFNMNTERVLAYVTAHGFYNPRYETTYEVILFGAIRMMDELKSRQSNGKSQQQTSNSYTQQKKNEEEQRKRQQQARPATIKGKIEYCAVLGLNVKHTATQLKAAYRTKAKLFHPDLQLGKTAKEKATAEIMSRSVNEANDYLLSYFKGQKN